MRRILLILVLITLTGGLVATTKLNDIRFGDYNDINRIVIITDKKPMYALSQSNTGDNSIYIRLSDCSVAASYNQKKNFASKVMSSLDIESSTGGLDISINTHKRVSFKKLELPGKIFKIVLDIYSTPAPNTYKEHLSYADFYDKVGYSQKAQNIYKQMAKKFPNKSDYYYNWGKILLKKKKQTAAIAKFKKVKNGAKNYRLSVAELKKLKVKPSKQKAKKIVADKQAKEKKPAEKVAKTEAMSIDYFTKYQEYFVKSTSPDHKYYIVGVAAQTAQDYDVAIKSFKKVKKDSALIPDIRKRLYNIHLQLNKPAEAKFYLALMGEADKPNTNTAFYNIPVKLWMVLVIILVAMAAVLFLLKTKKVEIEAGESEFTIADVDSHKKRIEEAYQAKPSPADELASEPEAKHEQDDNEPNTKFDNIPRGKMMTDVPAPNDPLLDIDTRDDGENMDWDNPPILNEKLTTAEEAELIAQEASTTDDNDELIDDLADDYTPDKTVVEIKEEQEEVAGSENSPLEEEDNDGENLEYKNEKYKRKVVLKLAADGWDVGAISKELKMSRREVEFILKVMS